tara:strand:+ start:487 stop:681 length:195 start_codon:yes stop_codon:yes gene_type:complete
MKLMITFVGILTVLGGAWPLIVDYDFIPKILKIIPSSGPNYQFVIIVIGVLAVLYGIRKDRYEH